MKQTCKCAKETANQEREAKKANANENGKSKEGKVFIVWKDGRKSIGWQERDAILTNRQIYALGFSFGWGERAHTVQIQLHACVVYGCLLVFAQRTPHIQSSTILQSRAFCCPFIRPIIYFVWALKLPLFWLVRQCFFSASIFFSSLPEKIDSLNIYLTAHSLYSECLPASDGFYVYFFRLVSNDFIHCTLLFKKYKTFDR